MNKKTIKAIDKFLNKHGRVIYRGSLVFVAIFTIAMFIFVKKDANYKSNPGLIPPASNYNIEVELDADTLLEYESTIANLEDQIDNFEPGEDEEIDLGGGIKGIVDHSNPDASRFLDMAQTYQRLGKYTESIETINDMSRIYPNNKQALEFLAETYAIVYEDEASIVYYKALSKLDPKHTFYIKQIAELYANLEDGKLAGEYYVKYEEAGGSRIKYLIEKISKLNK